MSILMFIIFIFYCFCIIYLLFFCFVYKSNKFGSKIELKEILCWKLVTFSSKNPREIEESRNQRGNVWLRSIRKIRKDPRSSDAYKTELGKYSVQKLNTIKTELFIFSFILKLFFSQLSNPFQKCHHSSSLPG